MTDHEKTAIRIGKWTPGMKCDYHYERPPDGEVAEPHQPHDIPCPALTSDDIFAWLLPNDSYDIRIYSYENTIFVEIEDEDSCSITNGEGPTLLAALENAVAKLPEAKE